MVHGIKNMAKFLVVNTLYHSSQRKDLHRPISASKNVCQMLLQSLNTPNKTQGELLAQLL